MGDFGVPYQPIGQLPASPPGTGWTPTGPPDAGLGPLAVHAPPRGTGPTGPQMLQQFLNDAKGFDPNLPDDAYNAQRDKSYDETVAPWLINQGYGPEALRDEWNQKTVRPQSTAYPRIGPFALGALSSATFGMIPEVEEAKHHFEKGAQLANVSPFWGGLGEMFGQLPYLEAGMGIAGEVGAALRLGRFIGPWTAEAAKLAAKGASAEKVAEAMGLTGGLAQHVANSMTLGVLQGAYEAAKNENQDNRVMSGLGGFVSGTIGGGVWEGGKALLSGVLGSDLSSALQRSGRLSKEEADAAATVARGGMPNDAATAALRADPNLPDNIRAWTAPQIMGARRAGVPKDMFADMNIPKDRLIVTMQGADGQPYELGGGPAGMGNIRPRGMSLQDFGDIIGRIDDHLKNGGFIQRIDGQPDAINGFYRMLERAADPADARWQFDWPAAPGEEGLGARVGAGRVYPNDTIHAQASAEEVAHQELMNTLERLRTELKPSQPQLYEGEKPSTTLGTRQTRPGPSQGELIDQLLGRFGAEEDVAKARALRESLRGRTAPYEGDIPEGTRPTPGMPRPELLDQLRESLEQLTREQLPSDEELLHKVWQLQYDLELNQSEDNEARFWRSREAEAMHLKGEAEAPEPEYEKLLKQSLARLSPPSEGGVGDIGAEGESRASVGLNRVPEGDLPMPDVERTHVPGAPELNRASANVSLNEQGRADVDALGHKLGAKGGFDKVYSGNLDRTVETAQALLRHSPQAEFGGTTPDLQSWPGLEGENSIYAKPYKESLAREQPDMALPTTEHSTRPGESFNQFGDRAGGVVDRLLDEAAANPDKRIAAVTHGSVIANTEARGARAIQGRIGDIPTDPDEFFKTRDMPGDVVRVERMPDGSVRVHEVNADSEEPLPPTDGKSAYLIRHGQTDWNTPTRLSVKDNPLYRRYVTDQEPPPGGNIAETSLEAPGRPSITFTPKALSDRMTRIATMFHEGGHAHSLALGMTGAIREAVGRAASEIGDSGIVHDIIGSFGKDVHAMYMKNPGVLHEEAYMYTAAAVRSNDQVLLERFGKADIDKEHVLDWVRQSSENIRERLAMQPDSLHKRTFERRLDAVVARSGRMLDDVNRVFDEAPGDVSFEDGHYVYRDADLGQVDRFGDRESLVNWMESKFQKPLAAPELVDTGALENFVPRYAVSTKAPNIQKTPITTDPPVPKTGAEALSFLWRPFYPWLDTVATKRGTPELTAVGDALQEAQLRRDNALAPFAKVLRETLHEVPDNRQADLFAYQRAQNPAARASVVQQSRLTPSELKMLDEFQQGMGQYYPLLEDYFKKLPKIEAANYDLKKVWNPGAQHDDIIRDLLQRGQLDPKDTNLLRVSSAILRRGLQRDFLDDPLSDFQKEIRTRVTGPDGEEQYKYGPLTPLLQHHVDYMRGVPDWTQKAMAAVIEAAVDKINQGLAIINPHLPGFLQHDPIDWKAKDVIDKYISLSYASGLALRPMVPIRDALQYFITSFPIIGGKYTGIGMKEAFPAIREGGDNDWVQQAIQHGAIITKRNLKEMYGGGEPDPTGAASGIVGNLKKPLDWVEEKSMSMISTAHNANRLVTFAAGTRKAEDAISDYLEHQNQRLLLRDSGLWFLPKGAQTKYVREIDALAQQGHAFTPSVSGPPTGPYANISMRIGAELTKATQWNFQTGAQAGIYKYGIGRLFGQYGTFPLNYIEYARRMMVNGGWSQGLGAPGVQAMMRLVLAHGAVLSAGAAAGIDTSQWVFTNPMAYGGGPLLKTVTDIPEAMDMQGRKGADARRELYHEFGPWSWIAGGDEFREMHDAITSHDPNSLIKTMGFQPLKPSDEDSGYYKFVPF